MQISIVYKSKLERTARIDAEYYRADFISLMEVLTQKGITKLTDLCKVSDGNHMSIAKYFVNDSSGVPYFRGQDILGFFIENITPVCIPEEIYHEPWMKRSHFQPNDILLTIVGTIGSISLVTEQIQKATGSCKIAILRPKRICSKYLSAFLLSKYGQQQLKRNIRGAVQTGLILEDFDQLLVYEASTNFQKIIQSLISKAILINRQSKQLYQQAEQYLLSELGLADWQPTHQATFVRSFSDFLQTARLDAEYFQPKYQNAMSIMGNSGNRIKDVALLTKRQFKPESNKRFHYIEIGNLSTEGYAESNAVMGEDAPSRAQWIVKGGDVITSTVRPIRRLTALIEPNQNDFVCSSGFAVLTPQSIEPELLLVYLRLPIVCEILDLHTTASMYPAISTTDLLEIPITVPENKEACQQIVQMVKDSRKSNRDSKHLLGIAKRGVELAIEQDEKAAEAWIQEQIKQLGIELTP